MAQPELTGQAAVDQAHEVLQREPLPTVCVAETIRTGQVLLDRVQRICQHYGLTLSTANVLAIIDGAHAPVSPQYIRERLLITGGAVTQLLDTLEQRQLVRRIPHPTDRRSVLIESTEQGKSLRATSQPYLKQCDTEWIASLTTDEQHLLIALLRKVQQHVATLVEPRR